MAGESSPFIQSKVKQALDKVAEATDPAQPLSQEEFVDDLALTSMARLWDVGKSEPIKVRADISCGIIWSGRCFKESSSSSRLCQ